MAKLSTVGDDIVKTKPQLKPLWDLLRAAAKRSLQVVASTNNFDFC